jgi:hypothetical protein
MYIYTDTYVHQFNYGYTFIKLLIKELLKRSVLTVGIANLRPIP